MYSFSDPALIIIYGHHFKNDYTPAGDNYYLNDGATISGASRLVFNDAADEQDASPALLNGDP